VPLLGGSTVSLNESPDCHIEKIIRGDAEEVIAVVSADLEDEQVQYFLRNLDCLMTDLHSSKARLGINQEKLTDFELKGNRISYEARFWFYIPEYSVGLTIDQLMTTGLEVGSGGRRLGCAGYALCSPSQSQGADARIS